MLHLSQNENMGHPSRSEKMKNQSKHNYLTCTLIYTYSLDRIANELESSWRNGEGLSARNNHPLSSFPFAKHIFPPFSMRICWNLPRGNLSHCVETKFHLILSFQSFLGLFLNTHSTQTIRNCCQRMIRHNYF